MLKYPASSPLKARSAAGRRGQSGYTLIELMIASTLFIILLGGMFKLIESGRSARSTTSSQSQMLQNVRVALDTISRDALNAGVGYPNAGAFVPDGKLTAIPLSYPTSDGDLVHDHLTPVVPGNNYDIVNAISTDTITFAYIDDTFNSGNALPISGSIPASNQLTIDTTQAPTGNAPCATGDLYVISGATGSAIGWLTGVSSTDKLVFAADPLGINNPGVSNGVIASVTYPATASKIRWVTYSIDSNGVLNRREYGSPANRAGNNAGGAATASTKWLDMPIALGVQNMQLQYVLTDNSVVDAPTAAQFQNIRQIKITLTVQTPEVDPRTNTRATTSLSTTLSVRNLGYTER